VKLEVGTQKPLTIIATHLHHEADEGFVRLEQIPALLSFWDDEPFSVILGDMNAWPGEPEMDLFEAAGLIDSWAEAGSGEGLTFSAVDPYQRIDWIFHTADLRAIQAQVINTLASDHLPVIVLLDAVK
jgi:endonuclease/exonuclease/phosphatase family metal-dependent hydrolase